MKAYLVNFVTEYDYPQEAREVLIAAYDTIVSSEAAAFEALLT